MQQKVISPIAEKYGSETEESYGSRLATAFLERMGEKARDEISLALAARSKEVSPTTRELLESLSTNRSLRELGNRLAILLDTEEISTFGGRQDVFESARNAKIEEFEEFYKREVPNASQ